MATNDVSGGLAGSAPAAGAAPMFGAAPAFAQAAHGQLATAAGAIAGAHQAAVAGTLHLTEDAAHSLIDAIGQARDQVDELCGQANYDLNRPLSFGRSWVGDLVGARLHQLASGGDRSAALVLEEFRHVLDEVESTVRAASGLVFSTEDDQRRRMQQLQQKQELQQQQATDKQKGRLL
ncbi:hypothetical protein F0L68_12820 [Solihabitans fulvus]|uniref:Uncharacterized protein n=1 Tax=Solihabitans fulvus TaxID=1892852 RepID=A0A5B2XFY1_9PSEU|nr:hypothetical protein [Solihabitans fulvus]KAA2262176.1 hypothetical protein F0L68_12820 [Solihabitans fulvus]